MTRLQEFLMHACNDLGLRIECPFKLVIGSDYEIDAVALLPQLGAAKGMIIVNRYKDLQGRDGDIVRRGYGYSVLQDPFSHETYDVNLFIDLFSDWGWSSKADKRPEWIKERPDDET